MSSKELKIKAIKGKDIKSGDGKILSHDFFQMYIHPTTEYLMGKDKKAATNFVLTTATVMLGELFLRLDLDIEELDNFMESVQENIKRIHAIGQVHKTLRESAENGNGDIFKGAILNGLRKLKDEINQLKESDDRETSKDEILQKVMDTFTSSLKDNQSDDQSDDQKIRVLPRLMPYEKWSCCENCENVEPKHFMHVLKSEVDKEKGLAAVAADFYYTCQNEHPLQVVDHKGVVELESEIYKAPDNYFDFGVDRLQTMYDELQGQLNNIQKDMPNEILNLAARVDIAMSVSTSKNGKRAEYRLGQVKALLDINESVKNHRKAFIENIKLDEGIKPC